MLIAVKQQDRLLGLSSRRSEIQTVLVEIIVPRTASATRALLRLLPCYRTYSDPTEVGLQAFPAPLQ